MTAFPPDTPDSDHGDKNLRQAAFILLDELSPFGIFLSQLIRMSGWIFPENQLPPSLQSLAERLESSRAETKKNPGQNNHD